MWRAKPHIYQIRRHKNSKFQYRICHFCKIKDGYLLDYCIKWIINVSLNKSDNCLKIDNRVHGHDPCTPNYRMTLKVLRKIKQFNMFSILWHNVLLNNKAFNCYFGVNFFKLIYISTGRFNQFEQLLLKKNNRSPIETITEIEMVSIKIPL